VAADTSAMSDSFSFGDPAKKWSDQKMRRRSPRRRDPASGGNLALSRGVLGAIAGAVALALFVVVLAVINSGGRSAAEADATAIAEIGKAEDTQTQVDLQTAYQTAMTLYESGDASATGLPSFANVTPSALQKAEPSLEYTDGASTGPGVISVKGAANEWGAAALSSSGTCLWVHLSSGSVSYGSGMPCTGSAAMSATGSSW
jgi:cytoskeletal protein RodZ